MSFIGTRSASVPTSTGAGRWISRGLAACLSLALLAAAPARAAPGKRAALQLRATLDRSAYGRTEPVQFTLTLKNSGKQPVWVNARFYVSAPDVPPDDRDVFLTVTGPAGRELECAYRHPTGFPKTDYFVRLEPGREASSEHARNLRSFFKLEEPGRYRLTATYHNVFGPELGLDAATGPFTSKPVEFTLTE